METRILLGVGRQRMYWVVDVMTITEISRGDLRTVRDNWRNTILNITRGRPRLDGTR